MSLQFYSELAADLARKINNGEKLSWQEAQDFKYRVTAKMSEVQAYLATESARLARESASLDPARGGNNEFQIRLNEINKLQKSLANKQDIITTIATATEHERDATRKLAQEGLAQFTGQPIVSSETSSTAAASIGVVPGPNPRITPESRAAGMASVAHLPKSTPKSAPKDAEINAVSYNFEFRQNNATEFDRIVKILEQDWDQNGALLSALKKFLATGGQTYSWAITLQKEIAKVVSDQKFSDDTSRAKGGPDGFFGPMSLAALGRVVGVSGAPAGATAPAPVSWAVAPGASKMPSAWTAPAKKASPKAWAATPSGWAQKLEGEKSADMTVAGLHTAFRKLVKSLDTNWTSATPESRKADNAKLMTAYTALRTAISQLSPAEQKSPNIRQIERELAEYFDGGRNNSHHKNPTEALAINLNLLKDMQYLDGGVTKSFDWPQIPTENDIEKALRGTRLMNAWNDQIAAGIEPNAALAYLLNNPKFKGEYEDVRDKVYGTFEDKLSALLKRAQKLNNAGQLVSPSSELIGAMEHSADILGNGWFTMSSHNWNKTVSIGKGGAVALSGAVLAGFGAGLAWNPVGWGGIAAGSAMVTTGIAAMTYAGAFYRGSNYATKWELVMETGIAALTLLPGVALYRISAVGAKAVAMGAKVGIPGLIVADYGANVAIGVSADQMRGLFHGTEVSFSSSLVQNLLFALAPAAGSVIANSTRATALATRAQSSFARLGHLKRNGGTPAQVNAAARDVESVAAEAAPLRATAAAQAEWAPVTPPTQPGEGAVAGVVAPKKPAAATDTADVRGTPRSVNSPKFNDALTRDLIALSEGQSLNIAEVSITRERNSFSVKKWETDARSFDNTPVWRKALGEYIQTNVTPGEIIHAGLSKARMKGLKAVSWQEVTIGGKIYKVHEVWESGIIIQKQVAPGQFRNLSAAEMDALSPTELVGLTDHIYGKGSASLIEAQLKKSTTNSTKSDSDSTLSPNASKFRLWVGKFLDSKLLFPIKKTNFFLLDIPRQPFVVAHDIMSIWAKNPKAMWWFGANSKTITENGKILLGNTGKSAESLLFGAQRPFSEKAWYLGWINAAATIILGAKWATSQVRNQAIAEWATMSDLDMYSASIVEYYKNMYIDAPDIVWSYIGGLIKEMMTPKNQVTEPTFK
jgi:hypothetical protein